MSSRKKEAQRAGMIYLALALTGVFSLLYVPSTLVVFDDAAATVENIRSSELLYRSGILVGLVSNVIFIFLALALYRLFKDVSQRQATLMMILVAISVAMSFANTVNQLGALIAMSDSAFLSGFVEPELNSLAYFFIRLHSWGIQVNQVFWGLWLVPFGILIARSGFIPKIFGTLLFIAAAGYVLASAAFLLLPQGNDVLSMLFMLMELAELPIIFWLLIVGANEQSPE